MANASSTPPVTTTAAPPAGTAEIRVPTVTGYDVPMSVWWLNGLIIVLIVAIALILFEAIARLAGLLRERRERLARVDQRTVDLQSLAARAVPDAGKLTMFRASALGSPAASSQAINVKADQLIAQGSGNRPAAAAVGGGTMHTMMTMGTPAAPPGLPAAAVPPPPKPAGWEPYKVLAVIDETPDVKSFRFVHGEGKPLAPFQAGQYLQIQRTVEGQAKPVIRCYSLSSAPHCGDYYQISVKSQGVMSKHLHGVIKAGDVVELKKPAGKFFLDPAQRLDLVLIAGGIGITPVWSMAQEFLHQKRRNRIDLFFGVRNEADIAYRKQLDELKVAHPNFHLHIVMSRPPEDGSWKGLKGRVDLNLIRRALLYNLSGRAYYMCGPPEMMSGISEGLEAQGVDIPNIHFEAFGPAAPRKAKAVGGDAPPAG